MKLEEKIMSFYNQKQKGQKDERIIDLLKVVLIDNETNIYKIEKLISTTPETIRKYSLDKNYMLKFLTEQEYELFIKKIDNIFRQEEMKDIALIGKIIDEILNGRQKIEIICQNNFYQVSKFSDLLNDEKFMDNNFGFGIRQKVKNRLAETSVIREAKPKNKHLVESRYDVFIAQENIYYLDEFDFKRLRLASDYLCSGANLEYVSKKHEIGPVSVISFLSNAKLKDILKPEYYSALNRYLKIESCLINNDLVNKKHILNSVVEILYTNNFNINETSEYFNLPKPLFYKILNEIMTKSYFNDSVRVALKNATEQEEMIEKKVR